MSAITDEYLRNESIASQPWPQKAFLYQPYEEGQILLAENASCLAVRTYLTMLELPFTVEQRANAEFMSPGGKRTKLPVLRVENCIYAEFEHILTFVELKELSLTTHLAQDDKDDMRAHLCLAEQIFTNAEQYVSWIDKEVLVGVTRQRNGSVYPFPLNHIQNWRKQLNVRRLLSVAEFLDITLEQVIDRVEKLCASLSMKLNDNVYFYGNEPTELDALVFGHLFSIFTMTLPNNVLAVTINKFRNLTQFCKNIEEKYFKKVEGSTRKR
ncbi:metaxin-2 [Toxorhynchites rutilus septentrionalis]|uniref:metaxin-2 n=1 Tax=Toxorhynchites rutilus septentrionalis TaxID=329112 RepID=UPI00247A05F1|nr:metaxin-2 [Toxorhynchites rutilus septentrionalis]